MPCCPDRMRVLHRRLAHGIVIDRSARFGIGLAALIAMLGPGICLPAVAADAPQPLRVLMLGGSSGSHRPAAMVELFRPALQGKAIELDYSEDTAAALRDESLARYDALAIFKDDGELTPEAERALVRFVESGRGLTAIHCASHAFRNSIAYTRLVGGRFLRHGHDAFRATIIDAQHPAVANVASFETRDETYVHNELADDIRVLMVRREEGGYEPYTWVRTQGKGRVYYTALGHDEQTWRQPAFHQLLIEALRWTAGRQQAAVDATRDEAKRDDRPSGETLSVADYTLRALTAEPPPPLSPAESMRRMHLPEGFAVELFAAEPDIVKPISMALDARGRLWVIESVDYPNDIRDPFGGNDRIKICEDTNGDGRADRFTIFAQGLNIPTSLLPYRDGVLAALAPHIVFLRDTDGDDVCDRREILFSGFGRFDPHAVHSNLRWGMDNWVWGTVGYSGGEIVVDGRRIRFKQGVFRFRPDGSDFEFLSSTSNNTWGLGFRETGEAFVSTANNQHSVQMAIPNRYFERVRGWHGQGSGGIEDHKRFHPVSSDLRQVDWHGEYTAAAGQTIYTARQFPAEYADRAALVCEPTGHLVHVDWLVPRGSAYVARDGWNLLASDDPWCAPIETHVGPDGAVWMIDWYNYIVRHNPTPPGFETGKGNAYVTPQRDKQHGRIYRIVYRGGEQAGEQHGDKPGDRPAEQPGEEMGKQLAKLAAFDRQALMQALASDNLWRRMTAQRLLVEQGDANVCRWLADFMADGQPSAALPHVVPVLAHYGAIAADAETRGRVTRLLEHPGVAVRRAALDALPRDQQSAAAVVTAGVLDDAELSVRLAALLALADMPGSAQTAAAIVALHHQAEFIEDRWLPLAAVSAAAPSAEDFLTALANVTEPSAGELAALAATTRPLAEHWARGIETSKAAADKLKPIVRALQRAEPNLAAAAVSGLAAGWPAGVDVSLDESFDEGAREEVRRLFAHLPAAGQLQLVELTRKWQAGDLLEGELAQIEETLLRQVEDRQRGEAERIAAAHQLAALASREEVLNRLAAVIAPQSSPALCAGLLDALATSSAEATAGVVLQAWGRMTPGVRRQAVGLLLRRPSWTSALLNAIEAREVAAEELALDQSQQLLRHPDRRIAARAKKLLAGLSPSSTSRAELVTALLPLSNESGDPQLGRRVFEQNCAKCHRHGALGESVGPDLTGIAARPREEILVDVIDPNRSVEGNYRQYVITTTGGEIFTGLLLAETQNGFELLDSQAKKHFIQRADVDEFAASSQSVMPEGFEKLAPDELGGLLEFLAARGRYLPLSLAKAATIASDRGMFYDAASQGERLIVDDWGPRVVEGVPFQLLDPRGGQAPNVVLLNGPPGEVSRAMPRSVSIACGLSARRIHLLSGVSGWGYPGGVKGSVSMIVRLHYADGQREEHPLQNGVHFADYIRRVDVPESQFAFAMRGQQMRYLAIAPRRSEAIDSIELAKGSDQTAPVVLAVTLELSGE